jgi:dTDP-4-dehydrorhamnose 3,5-epimerase
MIFTRTHIPDIVICQPKVLGDARGYFCEMFRQDRFNEYFRHSMDFCQENESKSSYGVLRGLHYQMPPFAQTKLVRVLEGRVLDVAVDIRAGSPYFGQHVSFELNSENKQQLLIPRGFAHGFVVLSEHATFSYKVDNFYNPELERGIAFDDPALGIDWQVGAGQLKRSPKDAELPLLKDTEVFQYSDNLYG